MHLYSIIEIYNLRLYFKFKKVYSFHINICIFVDYRCIFLVTLNMIFKLILTGPGLPGKRMHRSPRIYNSRYLERKSIPEIISSGNSLESPECDGDITAADWSKWISNSQTRL